MKKYLLSLLMLLSLNAGAQMLYRLDTSRMAYVELTSGSNISGAAWDSAQMVTLPFAFKYFHKPYNNLFISYDGIYFTDTGLDLFYYGLHDYMPQDFDITKSPITFDVSGAIGNRILKVQYKNIRESNTNSSFRFELNLQIWLYESNNHLEIHFGPSVITDPQYTSFVIGLTDEMGLYDYVIDGTATAPVVLAKPTGYDGIASFPGVNQVYTFVPINGTSVQTIHDHPFRIFNTTNGFVFNSKHSAQIELYDMSGKLVSSFAYENAGNTSVYNPQLNRGIYMVVVKTEGQIFTEKLHLSY